MVFGTKTVVNEHYLATDLKLACERVVQLKNEPLVLFFFVWHRTVVLCPNYISRGVFQDLCRLLQAFFVLRIGRTRLIRRLRSVRQNRCCVCSLKKMP